MASSEYYHAYWDDRRALTGLYPELRDLLARSIGSDARATSKLFYRVPVGAAERQGR